MLHPEGAHAVAGGIPTLAATRLAVDALQELGMHRQVQLIVSGGIRSGALTLPLVTTWPAFTEAMYLLARAGGIRGQRALWQLLRTGRLVVADLSQSAIDRAARLIDQYADRPMDLADATLVALAEDRRIFTLDADFHVYRLRGR